MKAVLSAVLGTMFCAAGLLAELHHRLRSIPVYLDG
jgi:hypothetical protein